MKPIPCTSYIAFLGIYFFFNLRIDTSYLKFAIMVGKKITFKMLKLLATIIIIFIYFKIYHLHLHRTNDWIFFLLYFLQTNFPTFVFICKLSQGYRYSRIIISSHKFFRNLLKALAVLKTAYNWVLFLLLETSVNWRKCIAWQQNKTEVKISVALQFCIYKHNLKKKCITSGMIPRTHHYFC
jgi:hypothetical protein